MWNVRNSWKYFQQAEALLLSFPDSDKSSHRYIELVKWSKFGLGLFNLLISILPATVIKVAQYIGFSADRKLGLAYLTECYEDVPASSTKKESTPSAPVVLDFFLAPFACMMVLAYYVSISVFIGQVTRDNLKVQRSLVNCVLSV